MILNTFIYDYELYDNNYMFFKDYIKYVYIYLKECSPLVVKQATLSSYKGLIFCVFKF